jgi:hypothetical protein
MKLKVFVLLLLFLIPITVSAMDPVYNHDTGDYRPRYNFTYDVFKELPKVPQDFWTKKNLLDTQQAPASRLTEEYYLQPEIIPGWIELANRTYSDVERKEIGVYGVSIYPSRFDIFGAKEGDTFNVSGILHSGWGVQLYQGLQLDFSYDKSYFNVTMVKPEQVILLEPTYPYFHKNWSVLFLCRITVLKEGNQSIRILERTPPDETDYRWSQKYGSNYTSGGSFLGLKVPKVWIYVHGVEKEDETPSNPTFSWFDWKPIIIIGAILLGVTYYAIRRKKKKRRDSKQETKESNS